MGAGFLSPTRRERHLRPSPNECERRFRTVKARTTDRECQMEGVGRGSSRRAEVSRTEPPDRANRQPHLLDVVAAALADIEEGLALVVSLEELERRLAAGG